MDACLGSPEPVSGIYHYNILAPCLVNSANITTNETCADMANCTKSLKNYALSAYSNNKTDTFLGIAKDGHMIVGPYKSDATLYSCKLLDQCGGISVADILSSTSYVYVFQN